MGAQINIAETTDLESGKSTGTRLEEKIKKLLTDLEFEDIDGARDNFLINGVQVDVCAGWENALLIIECKSKQVMGKKSLRQAINEFRGKIPLLETGFASHPVYQKYTFFKFILVTSNIDVRKDDYEYANQKPNIYIWNDDFFEYYSDLYSFIRPYAKFDLLGEMGVKPLYSNPITIPAIQTEFGNTNIYNFVMNPKDLLEVAFVARREVGKERYYQRVIDKERLLKIADYIKKGGKFPNNIIIAFREGLGVKFHRIKGPKYSSTDWPYHGMSYGVLEFPKDYRSCWVIDGQHRLYSFINLNEEFYFNMPITAFENITLEEQRKFFLDINRNQRAVDSDLLWDLSADVLSENEGVIASVVKLLNTDSNSPLFHQIYYPSTGIKDKKDKIKISALCMAIKKRKLADENTPQNMRNFLFIPDKQSRVKKIESSLAEYFWVLKDEFSENWQLKSKGFVCTNGGISVMIGLYEKILSRISQKKSSIPKTEDFVLYLMVLKDYFKNLDSKELKNLRLRCTSEGGKSELLEELVLKIRSNTGDDSFGGEIKQTKFNKEFTNLEKNIKELIKFKLSNNEEKWFSENLVGKDIYEKSLKKLKKNGLSDVNKLYLQPTLGECFSIMRSHKRIFFQLFTDENSDFSFDTEQNLENAFNHISSTRAKMEAHYTGAKIKAGDEEILKIYLDKLNKCIQQAISNID